MNPREALDRDALDGLLRKWAIHRGWDITDVGIEDMAEDILALVRPVAGVTLTPDEAGAIGSAVGYAVSAYADATRGRPAGEALAEAHAVLLVVSPLAARLEREAGA